MDKYRATEAELYKYRQRVARVRVLQMELSDILEESPLRGFSSGDGGSSGKIGDPVGDFVANQNDRAEKKRKQIEKEEKPLVKMEKAFSVLNHAEEEIIIFRYFKGYGWKELAERCGYSVSHAKKLRRDGVEKISEVLW